jgi:hypothetical protein
VGPETFKWNIVYSSFVQTPNRDSLPVLPRTLVVARMTSRAGGDDTDVADDATLAHHADNRRSCIMINGEWYKVVVISIFQGFLMMMFVRL